MTQPSRARRALPPLAFAPLPFLLVRWPRALALLLAALALAALALLPASGCGRRGQAPAAGDEGLSHVAVSADLAPAYQAGLAALRGPAVTTAAEPSLARYAALRARVRDAAAREAVADEIYALWEADPDDFGWLELAKQYQFLLRRGDDLARMAARPELSDTATAVGDYVQARMTYRRGSLGELYLRAEQRQDRLDPLQRTWLQRKLALVADGAGDPLGAVRRLIAALPAARAAGGTRLEAALWGDITDYLIKADRLDDALHASRLAVGLAEKVGDAYAALEQRVRRAGLFADRDEREHAVTTLLALADEAQAGGHAWPLQLALNDAAEISAGLGDYERTLAIDRRLLAVSRAAGDDVNVYRNLASVAHDQRMLGQLDSCRVNLERAVAVFERTGNEQDRFQMAALAAKYYCHVGRFDVADSLLTAAAGPADAQATAREQALILLEILPQAVEIGRPDLAYAAMARLRQLERALQDTGPDQNLRADFELASARLLAHQGEFRLAAEALVRAEAAVRTQGGPGRRLQVRLGAGELALLREDLAAAETAFADAVALAGEAGDAGALATSRFQLGHILLKQGRGAEARALFQAQDPDSSFGHPFRTRLSTMLFLGVALAREGRHAEALARFARLDAQLTPRSPADLVARLRIEQGRSLLAVGRRDDARSALEAALALLQGPGERSQVAELRAFHASARREALELLVGLRVDRGDDGAATLAQARRWLVAGALSADAVPVLPAPRPGAPWLVFLVGEERSFAWVVAADGTAVHRLPGRAELHRLVAPVVADLARPDRPVDAAALERLAAVLLAPLQGRWAENGVLRVAPDGLLHGIPWSALPVAGRPALEHGPVAEVAAFWTAAAGTGELGGRGDGDGRAATAASSAAQHPTAPSALTLLAVGRDDAGEAGRKAAAANSAATGGEPLPRLRRAEDEARRVAALWPADRRRLRTGAQADWAQLAAADLADAGVLHLATHAQVFQGLPQRSTLRLGGGPDAAPVTVTAVAGLDLRTELVFLSCCSAARRLSAAGDGVSDFAGAFQQAGARTVIASSLWVDDDAAAFLAERFYRHWLDGKSRAEALRSARLDLRAASDRWRHPAYWAFYRLIGDPD